MSTRSGLPAANCNEAFVIKGKKLFSVMAPNSQVDSKFFKIKVKLSCKLSPQAAGCRTVGIERNGEQANES